MFSPNTYATLARSCITKNTPIYVQFYITARCNLTCQQCNIRYANADVRECTLEEIKRIAENFAKIGVAIVLLTGGEPFARTDLPEIIKTFTTSGIHVRMQTNGLASEEMIHKAIIYGGRDISISLDSLKPKRQDTINGGYPGSWERAIRAVSLFTTYLPVKNSFASFGCVLQPFNLQDIIPVIEFGTKIGWHTSLVPIHTTTTHDPRSFRTYNTSLQFKPTQYKKVDALIEKIRNLRDKGYLLYDSDQYLNDIKQFIRNKPTSWREKHNGVCDSPNLYFAVLPNGDFAPCCDWRMPHSYPTYAKNFPTVYKNRALREETYGITNRCSGCMYGSYPEITISMRYIRATMQRFKTFVTTQVRKPWPLTEEALGDIAGSILKHKNSRSLPI